MSQGSYPRVDALFAGDPPPSPDDPLRHARRVRLLLVLAWPLILLALPCWTGVPGALLALWAWLLLGDHEHPPGLRRAAGWALGVAVASLVAQAWLLTTAWYPSVLNQIWSPLLP